jgi:hypothetical protein
MRRSGSDVIKVLEAERDADVITLQMEVCKSEAAVFRKQLRGLLFKGVKQPDGTLRFYLADEVPVGANTDGRDWRLKVGNRPLKTDRILCPAAEKSWGHSSRPAFFHRARSISTLSCPCLALSSPFGIYGAI